MAAGLEQVHARPPDAFVIVDDERGGTRGIVHGGDRMLSSAPSMANRMQRATAIVAALGLVSCNAFRRAGPTEADPVNPPRLVSVTIEYRQINECLAGSPQCDGNVVF